MFLRDLLMASLSDIVVTDYTAGHFARAPAQGTTIGVISPLRSLTRAVPAEWRGYYRSLSFRISAVIVPTTTKATAANITAYSAMSCPRSSDQASDRKTVRDMFPPGCAQSDAHCHCFLTPRQVAPIAPSWGQQAFNAARKIPRGSRSDRSVHRFPPRRSRQLKPFMEHANAHHGHQDLIVGNPSPLIHGMQAVQQANHLLSIEEWNRPQDGPT